MLGVVLSDNVILLVVFWELTSLSSFLLIGFWSHKPEGRQGARMALVVTGTGGLALLAGVLLLAQVAGTTSISEILTRGDVVRASPLYGLILALVLAGAFTKSRSSHSTSGCRTPWRRRRLSPPTCIRPRW